jgi:hypothetical protein
MYESAFAVAIADEPVSIALARQQSHDQVIVNAGPARRSGVRWSDWRPASEAQKQLAADGCDVTLPDEAAQVIQLFPDGVLVMATVEIEA